MRDRDVPLLRRAWCGSEVHELQRYGGHLRSHIARGATRSRQPVGEVRSMQGTWLVANIHGPFRASRLLTEDASTSRRLGTASGVVLFTIVLGLSQASLAPRKQWPSTRRGLAQSHRGFLPLPKFPDHTLSPARAFDGRNRARSFVDARYTLKLCWPANGPCPPFALRLSAPGGGVALARGGSPPPLRGSPRPVGLEALCTARSTHTSTPLRQRRAPTAI